MAETAVWTEEETATEAVKAVVAREAVDVVVAMAVVAGTAASLRALRVGKPAVEVTASVDGGSVEAARALVSEETAVVAEPALGSVVA